MKFTHLHTHSHYSLLDGLTKIDELVDRTKELGMDSVALTDHGAMYGVIEFYKKAKKAGVKPIIGCEMYVTDNMHDKRSDSSGKAYYHLVLLAENNIGYKNLIKLVTKSNLEGFYYKPRVDKNLLEKHSEGIIALSACLGGELSQVILRGKYDKAKKIALRYQAIFGKDNYFIEVQQHLNLEDQNKITPQLVKLARELNIPMVATQDSHYCKEGDAEAHDILLAIQTGNKVSDKSRLSLIEDDFSFASSEKMIEKFKEIPEAIENTIKIADRCNVEIELGNNQLPEFPLPEGVNADEHLKNLCEKGLKERYPEIDQKILDRIEYELGVIKKTGFASYFLIVQDYINWAKDNGIIVGPGRGSAAGSIVSYILKITNIDPLKYDLIFERFLNPERVSMPDIDVDFDDARRNEVFEYVREKYGRDHFAQVITFGTMAARGSVRDAGRALGYPYELCDQIAKLIPFNPNQGKKEGALMSAVEEVEDLRQLYKTNRDVAKIINSAAKLEGVVRHSSTHACAVVISPKPLTEYLPLQKGTHEGDIITQYEMHGVEDIGLLKMDFLGLSNLTIIHRALEEIKKNHGVEIDLDKLPLDDKKTFRLFQQAKTTGIFQLESPGMKRYLKTLKPTTFEDIIVMISLYRPGPLDAGMVEEYIERKHGRKKVTYLHPLMEPILKNTYGIIVYQEQLMQIANILANFTLPQGYMLIKAVGKKIRSLLEEQKERLIDGMTKNNIESQTAIRVWEFIEPFARYGFNRSHGACYALIGYQTAYLKANYPVEFMSSLLNSSVDNIERTAFILEEAQSMNIKVLPPQVNESFEDFTVVQDTETVRFGLTAIKNVGSNIVKEIIEERTNNGIYKNVEDFVLRVNSLGKKTLESLIKCGVLDIFGDRGVLLHNTDKLLAYARDQRKNSANGQVSLFGDATDILMPLTLDETDPASKTDKLRWEKELLGLYISDHPLRAYQPQLESRGVISISSAATKMNRNVKLAGLVTKTKRITTKNGEAMVFSTIEDMSSKMEIVVFPKVFGQNPEIWQENNILIIEGKVNDRNGALSCLCNNVESIGSLA